jgi:hypothetical protein
MTQPFLSIDLSANFGIVSEKMFANIENQIGYAAKLTVNDLAFDVKRAVDAEMRAVFHKPTPFTMSAIRVIKDEESARETITSGGIPMRVNRTEFSAIVALAQQGMPASSKKSRTRVTADDAWEKALKHQFTGGIRPFKRWEAALHWKKVDGKPLIPDNHYAVPASGCPMDSYDNPVPGFMVQLLAYFEAFNEIGKGYRSNMNDKRKRAFEKRLEKKMGEGQRTGFFISDGKGLPKGIWQRIKAGGKTSVKPIFLFFPATAYRPLLDFRTLAANAITGKVADRFSVNMKRAIRTAKR